MSLRGQRFELDLGADDFTAPPLRSTTDPAPTCSHIVGEIKEREPNAPPAAPRAKASKTGFPEHRKRTPVPSVKQQQARRDGSPSGRLSASNMRAIQLPPSDKAIAHHVGKKHGDDFDAQEKAQISDENKQRIAAMSEDDIEEARAELMANLDPRFIERLLRRANIDDDQIPSPRPKPQRDKEQVGEGKAVARPSAEAPKLDAKAERAADNEQLPRLKPSKAPSASAGIHFPTPPRPSSSFVPLDPNAPSFISDLKEHYFPDTPHDPSTLSWLQDPATEDNQEYDPAKDSYAASDLRFSFVGTLIPPKESREIDVSKGLHHHGLAPSSAGYTIPELAILSRSTLPNQRCIAWQVLGRMLYRLGRGDFGPRGSELQEGLWSVVEKERVLEVMLAEANRPSGHVSAKAYATDALWLWRKGGGGDRGLLMEGEVIAK